MTLPTRVATAQGQHTAATNTTVTLPSGIANDDILIAVLVAGTGTLTWSDAVSKGWTVWHSQAFGTRNMTILARVYNSGDAGSTYVLTKSTSTAVAWVTAAVRGVSALGDAVLGSAWRRQDNGGSQGLIVAPTLSAPDDSLVLAIFGEATTTAGSPTPSGSFTSWAENTEDGSLIEYAGVYYAEVETAATSPSFSLTWTPTANNGWGAQIALPGAADPDPPSDGQIGVHLAAAPASDSLTIGAEKIGGTVVEAVLYDAAGTTELDRATVSFSSPSQWGSVTFTGLSAATEYEVRFEVDGEEQTDAALTVRTLPSAAASYVAVAGSCQATGSTHPIFGKMLDLAPVFLAHMGDLHYEDATLEAAWRAGVESSLTAGLAPLLEETLFSWVYDNHDRIITDEGGDSGNALNVGTTDSTTPATWKLLAGSSGWASSGGLGRTWVAGRVRYIQTDHWSERDDADFDSEPRTFLGATQKAWWKDTLENATEPVIVWFTQWTAQNNANGRWNSFDTETDELEAWLDARPAIKRRLILIGGDSHSMQADTGTRTTSHRFVGVPSLNISGFNKSADTAAADNGDSWDLGNVALRTSGESEADWGGYSKLTVTDAGGPLSFRWDAVRVDASGDEDVLASFERVITTATGGVTLGGTAEAVARVVTTASGGPTLGGTASVQVRVTVDATGGVTLGGSAATVAQIVITAAGGITLGGQGDVEGGAIVRTATGGITLGGSADVAIRVVTTATGGITLAGSAAATARISIDAAGGIVMGGSATAVARVTTTALGGVALGGTATVTIPGESTVYLGDVPALIAVGDNLVTFG